MHQIYRGLITETTQSVLADFGRPEEMCYGIIIQYINRFLWEISDYLPSEEEKIWGTFRGHPIEYLAAIRIRDAAVAVGNELKRNFPIGTMEKTNYAVLNYIRRLVLLDNEKGDAK